MDIIIWGTGAYAEQFVKDLQEINLILQEEFITVDCFIDSNRKSDFMGIPVLLPDQLTKKDLHSKFIVVAVNYRGSYQEIVALLVQLELKENVHFMHISQFYSKVVNEKLGYHEEKYELYKLFVQKLNLNLLEERLAEVYYQVGKYALTLKKEYISHDEIECLVKAFQWGYKSQKIIELLKNHLLDEQSSLLRLNYQKNTAALPKSLRTLFPAYDQLPAVFFPYAEEYYIFFDKRKNILSNGYQHFYEVFWEMMKKDFEGNIPAALTRILLEEEKRVKSLDFYNSLIAEIEKTPIIDNLSEKIEEYHRAAPNSVKYYEMLGLFFYRKEKYALALSYIEQGLKKNILNKKLCNLMAEILFALKNYGEAVKYFILGAEKENYKLYPTQNHQEILVLYGELKEKIKICIDQTLEDESKKILEKIAEAFTSIRYFPFKKTCQEYQGEKFIFDIDSCVGDELQSPDGRKYVVGLYYDDNYLLPFYRDSESLLYKKTGLYPNSKCYLDVVEMEKTTTFFWNKNEEALLPLMPTKTGQAMEFVYKGKQYQYRDHGKMDFCRFNKLQCDYFRFNEALKIRSDIPFFVGKPVQLKMDKTKPKIIINIVLDGLSYDKIGKNIDFMPHTKEFFRSGLHFTNAFAPAEWTFPAIAAIHTGCYIQKTQLYDPKANVTLSCDYKTIAERMEELGYYCLNFSTVLPALIYAGVYRGFHRSIGRRNVSAKDYIAEALSFMSALDEKNLFVNLHLFDIHDAAYIPNTKLGSSCHLDLNTILDFDDENSERVKSAQTAYSKAKNNSYEKEIENTDRALNVLWSYLSSNYDENDYIVALYADHGTPIVGIEKAKMKSGYMHVPFMLKGLNLADKAGIVDDIVSTVDLYQVYAKLLNYEIPDDLDCRLPKTFGGQGREYVVSNSLYPGQTYKLAVNTLQYEFRLETKEKVSDDGFINMDSFDYQIFERSETHARVYKKSLAEKFIKIALSHVKYMNER